VTGDALDVLTVGETMALVAATSTGPFAVGSPARMSFAGAASTGAIGLARLGHRAGWIGRLGTDPLGSLVVNGLRAEGVDVSGVRRDAEAPTGLLLREHRTADRVRVSYYRRGLAGSRLAPEDVPSERVAAARVLHVTGITPALSETAARAVGQAVDVAASAGVTVSLDLNYRSALWTRAEAAPTLRALAERADLVFGGPDEIALVFDGPDEKASTVGAGDGEALDLLAERLAALGPSEVVVKLAADGARAYAGGDRATVAARRVTVVDPVGAGDAFVAGYLSGLLDGLPLQARLERADFCGACAVSVAGDWEGLPRREELGMLAGPEDVGR